MRMRDVTSDTVVSSTGAPQGTILAPLLYTLYTLNLCYNSDLCHIQKFADDTEDEYRSEVKECCLVPKKPPAAQYLKD